MYLEEGKKYSKILTDIKGPHISNYAKELCDKLEHSMCAVAGGPYRLRYSITD